MYKIGKMIFSEIKLIVPSESGYTLFIDNDEGVSITETEYISLVKQINPMRFVFDKITRRMYQVSLYAIESFDDGFNVILKDGTYYHLSGVDYENLALDWKALVWHT